MNPFAPEARRGLVACRPLGSTRPSHLLARRLENPNTFVHFGAGPGVIRSTGPVETYEVGPGGEILWHVGIRGEDVDERFVAYRAWPVTSLVGETILED